MKSTFKALLLGLVLAAGSQASESASSDDYPSWDGDLETLHEHAAPSSSGKTELMAAAGEGRLAAVRRLVEDGAAVDERNANGGTALMYAVAADERETATFLLANGADANARARIGWTPLLVAAAKGRARMVELLPRRSPAAARPSAPCPWPGGNR